MSTTETYKPPWTIKNIWIWIATHRSPIDCSLGHATFSKNHQNPFITSWDTNAKCQFMPYLKMIKNNAKWSTKESWSPPKSNNRLVPGPRQPLHKISSKSGHNFWRYFVHVICSQLDMNTQRDRQTARHTRTRVLNWPPPGARLTGLIKRSTAWSNFCTYHRFSIHSVQWPYNYEHA